MQQQSGTWQRIITQRSCWPLWQRFASVLSGGTWRHVCGFTPSTSGLFLIMLTSERELPTPVPTTVKMQYSRKTRIAVPGYSGKWKQQHPGRKSFRWGLPKGKTSHNYTNIKFLEPFFAIIKSSFLWKKSHWKIKKYGWELCFHSPSWQL